MPPGREFEACRLVDTQGQPIHYHNHPHYEFYFYIQGNSRIVVEGLDPQPVKGDVLIYPPGIMHRNIHLNADGAVKSWVRTVKTGAPLPEVKIRKQSKGISRNATSAGRHRRGFTHKI